jgi:energy-coupling factor transport system ATP-binding protein
MNLTFDNVSFTYASDRPLLKSLSFEAGPSDVLLIVGQNGVGKSTLLKLSNGILKPTAGHVRVGGLDTTEQRISKLAREICVTFQNPADQIFAPTVEKEVSFAPRNLGRIDPAGLAMQAMALCGLDSVATQHPYDLPPAQRKLLTIASAVASGAPLLAFDEPSAGLSQLEHRGLERILASLKIERRGLIVVSHDLGYFLRHATKVLVLRQGETLYYGTPEWLAVNEGVLRKAGLKLPIPERVSRMLGQRPEQPHV